MKLRTYCASFLTCARCSEASRPMPTAKPIVAVTGANGFIGSNLTVRLRELGLAPHMISRDTPAEEARLALGTSDIVFHLAGANRPEDPSDFIRSNESYAWKVANIIADGDKLPLVVCSSTV